MNPIKRTAAGFRLFPSSPVRHSHIVIVGLIVLRRIKESWLSLIKFCSTNAIWSSFCFLVRRTTGLLCDNHFYIHQAKSGVNTDSDVHVRPVKTSFSKSLLRWVLIWVQYIDHDLSIEIFFRFLLLESCSKNFEKLNLEHC